MKSSEGAMFIELLCIGLFHPFPTCEGIVRPFCLFLILRGVANDPVMKDGSSFGRICMGVAAVPSSARSWDKIMIIIAHRIAFRSGHLKIDFISVIRTHS